jgi:alkanesulfonate monooxygenase SsuD/methylene tetrahydromethanopterin reductase-like flavin-dependent oxidoreductase (luciferase family)
MKFALFNQLQMPKPWRENAEALMRKEAIEEGIIIGGDPDSVCRGIERWRNLGLDLILLMLGAGRTSHDQVMRALDLLGEKVIPKFK